MRGKKGARSVPPQPPPLPGGEMVALSPGEGVDSCRQSSQIGNPGYVDGGSPAYVRRYIETEARRRGFDLIRTGFYLSPNRARNMALKQVRTEYVVFLDNDVQVGPGWLENLLRCAEETGASVVSALTCQGTPADEIVHCADGDCHISVGGDGRRHLIEKIHLQGQRVSDVRSQLRRTETELAEFHCMLVRSQIFEQIGNARRGIAEHERVR